MTVLLDLVLDLMNRGKWFSNLPPVQPVLLCAAVSVVLLLLLFIKSGPLLINKFLT